MDSVLFSDEFTCVNLRVGQRTVVAMYTLGNIPVHQEIIFKHYLLDRPKKKKHPVNLSQCLIYDSVWSFIKH